MAAAGGAAYFDEFGAVEQHAKAAPASAKEAELKVSDPSFISAAENAAIDDMAHRLEGTAAPDRTTMLRFLRARKLNVNEAIEMYHKAMQWRRENGVDKVLEEEPPLKDVMPKLVSNAHHKCDRHGRPLYIERTGRIHINTFAKVVSPANVIKTHIILMETLVRRMKESSQRLGKEIHQGVYIMDMDGLGMAHSKMVWAFRGVSQIDQDYYPEHLGAMYIVNVPWIFDKIWGLIKPFLDKKTRQKIHILGRDLAPLVADLGPECLPVEYGGTCRCAGGCMNETASKEELARLNIEWVADDPAPDVEPELKERVVAARDKFRLELRCAHERAAVHWYWRVAAKDIGFSVEFTPARAGAAPKIVVPHARVDAAKGPVEGSFVAEEEGVCALVWDNSYSMLSVKTVRYFVSETDVLEDDAEASAQPAAPAK